MNTSQATRQYMKDKGMEKLEIESFFPIDNPYCVCKKQIVNVTKELMSLSADRQVEYKKKKKRITCERDKTGMKFYTIFCKNCGEKQGTLWAKDDSLCDFCDFHYYQWTDGENWHGCLTPNLSPITLKLTIQCYCGTDTRDFRPNSRLDPSIVKELEAINSIGREFGKPDSKFSAIIEERRTN